MSVSSQVYKRQDFRQISGIRDIFSRLDLCHWFYIRRIIIGRWVAPFHAVYKT